MRKYILIAGAGLVFLWSLSALIKTNKFPTLAPKAITLVEASYDDLENWSSDHQGLALGAFQKSCSVFLAQPASQKLTPLTLGGTVGDWQPACRKAVDLPTLTDVDARQFFEQYFTLLSYPPEIEGLFTGYFAPEYLGSATPSEDYSYPLYGLPQDLKVLDLGQFSSALKGKSIIGEIRDGEFVPYKDRQKIDAGALDNRQLELVWLKDPVDAFFLHIQGSGVIRYENGDRQLFGYAGKNGQAYHAIGKFLIESGDISREDMSMQAIRQWITDNPAKARDLMWKNPSYVFFQSRTEDSPVGTMNVPLTAGRSLAVDREYVPLGMPVWLDLNAATEKADPIRRLAVAQDTGGAIKGRVRADVYWGIGDEAGRLAGPMKDRGHYYFLVPNDLATRILNHQDGVAP